LLHFLLCLGYWGSELLRDAVVLCLQCA
jgi:hypothetical protein